MNPQKVNLDLVLELLAYLGACPPLAGLPPLRWDLLLVGEGGPSTASCAAPGPPARVEQHVLSGIADSSPRFRDTEGAVLIFLPGLAHIQQLYDLLLTDRRFSPER